MKQLQHYNLKIPKTEKVCRPSVSPVIICVIPVVKVNKEAVIDDISNRGDADKSRILSVDCLQFHPHPEPTSLKDRQGIDRYVGQTDKSILTAAQQVNRKVRQTDCILTPVQHVNRAAGAD